MGAGNDTHTLIGFHNKLVILSVKKLCMVSIVVNINVNLLWWREFDRFKSVAEMIYQLQLKVLVGDKRVKPHNLTRSRWLV